MRVEKDKICERTDKKIRKLRGDNETIANEFVAFLAKSLEIIKTECEPKQASKKKAPAKKTNRFPPKPEEP